jgi:hypothetical protein
MMAQIAIKTMVIGSFLAGMFFALPGAAAQDHANDWMAIAVDDAGNSGSAGRSVP